MVVTETPVCQRALDYCKKIIRSATPIFSDLNLILRNLVLSENAINDYLKGERGSLRLSLERLCDAIDREQRGPQTNRGACPLGANTATAPFAVPQLASLPSQQVLFQQRFLSSPPASAA